jgi:hypothetical protein
MVRAERSGALLVRRHDVLAQFLKTLATGEIRERFDDRRVELRDGGGLPLTGGRLSGDAWRASAPGM